MVIRCQPLSLGLAKGKLEAISVLGKLRYEVMWSKRVTF